MTIRLRKPLVYVTRDIERALGREPKDGYFVISNDTPYGRMVRERYPDNVWLVGPDPSGEQFDTYGLLSLPSVAQAILERGADVLVFQNTARIERLASERGWNLLNPSAALAKEIEEKVSQIAWLEKDAELLPPHRIAKMKDVVFEGKRFVLQFNHSHTGEGTHVIESADALSALAVKFPERECRVVEFVDGPVLTVNVVSGSWPIIGSISYQITGIAPFTDLPFSTIGNDWSLAASAEFTNKDRATIRSMARKIGRRMHRSGWKGLFGIDVVKDSTTGKIHLLEINARQPASTAFESQLQTKTTIFDAHIAALLGRSWKIWRLSPLKGGSQIVKRKTEKTHTVDTKALESKGLAVIKYEAGPHNKELFRIQSNEGVIAGHGRLNALGNFIASCIR
ncbi:MAG: ATP-grasp domain-containing protein [bacterium]|nr:ATP-grasp domain-containing protein [bacterium]